MEPSQTPASVPNPIQPSNPIPPAGPPTPATPTSVPPSTIDPAPSPVVGMPVGPSGMPARSGRPLLKIIIILTVLLVLGAAAYGFFIAPKMALPGYLNKLSKAKTTTIAASISNNAKNYRFTLKLNGKDDLTTTDKPKIDLDVTGQISSNAGPSSILSNSASGSLSAHLIMAEQKLYFKIESFSYLTQLLSIKLPNDWYKYDIASSDTGKCATKTKDSGSFLGGQLLTKVPVKNARLAGIETVNGALSMHYVGTIDNSKIKAAIDAANKNLSAACKIDITENDYKDFTASYDLWRGWSKDRLKLAVTYTKDKSTTEITLDTGAYNKPEKIDAPADAKDVSELLKDIFGYSVSSASDITRKNDLATLTAAVENSAADNNGTYPASATEVSKLSFTATDPTTKKPYSIIATKPTAVGQIQYLRSASCNAATNLAVAASNSRTVALVTLLGDGKTYYCMDNQ